MGLLPNWKNLTKSLRAVMPGGGAGMADVNCRSGTGRVVEYRTGVWGGPRGGVILEIHSEIDRRYWDSVLTAWRARMLLQMVAFNNLLW